MQLEAFQPCSYSKADMKILTAAELKKTFVLIQWKSGELHAFTDNGDVTPENLTLQPRTQ